MAAKKRGLRGAGHVRRLMKRLPDDARAGIAEIMQDVEPAATAIARGGAPVRRGNLRSLITGKVYAKSLRFRVGLLSKAARSAGWYGYILEVGRRAQTVQVKRRTPSGGVTQYALRVSPILPSKYDIVRGRARRAIRGLFRAPLTKFWDSVLLKASLGAGATDD